MAASSEIVNAATTNGLDLQTAKPPIFSLCHGHANWAFLYSESALRILQVDARFKLHRDRHGEQLIPTSQKSR